MSKPGFLVWIFFVSMAGNAFGPVLNDFISGAISEIITPTNCAQHAPKDER